jgi:hypothetical protein
MRTWMLIVVAVLVLFGPGCAMIKPTTELTGPGFAFRDTKDNDVTVKKVEYNPETKALTIKDLAVSNKASPVIRENVKQMLAFVEQQKAANEGIRIALSGLRDLVKEMIPFLNLTQDTMAAVLHQLATIDAQIEVADMASIKLGQQERELQSQLEEIDKAEKADKTSKPEAAP